MVTLTRSATVRTLSHEGRSQRYWDFSPVHPAPQRSAGEPTLFMVHGFRGDHHGMLRIVEELPTHRIVIPDLPGFGESDALPGRHDTTAYMRFVKFSFDQLGLTADTVLVGHSYGSIVASEFAARHSSAISALILINPICEPALEGSSRIASRLAELYYLAAAALPERAGRAVLSNRLIVRAMSIFMAKTRNRELRKYIHGQHRAYFSAFASRRVVLEVFRASISGTVREHAHSLRMPVLMIVAEKDDIGSLIGQRQLASLIPDARLEIIPDVGHLIHYEKPQEAAALIGKFLTTAQQGNQ